MVVEKKVNRWEVMIVVNEAGNEIPRLTINSIDEAFKKEVKVSVNNTQVIISLEDFLDLASRVAKLTGYKVP